MKYKLLILLGVFALASCSQKQFSFRKTIKVNQHEQVKLEKKSVEKSEDAALENIETLPSTSAIIEESVSQKDVIAMPTDKVLSAELNPSYETTLTPFVEKNQSNDKVSKEKTTPLKITKLNKKTSGDGSTSAILGFIFGVVGVIGIFLGLGIISVGLLVAGIILSAFGLKSRKSKLAMAGHITSIVALTVWLIVLVVIAFLEILSGIS